MAVRGAMIRRADVVAAAAAKPAPQAGDEKPSQILLDDFLSR
ncbi:hypothetical protein HMPREF9205_2177 [Cutibacterium acnes SK182]|nr:hypothetical protein HMPREF0675_4847 [Cutibacterium acnes SK137]EGR95206.1 hypothetical protein HMPREF9205_2177 [Cutibacterium acnes SK182]